MLGHDTDALSDYDQAISLDPDFTDVLLRRAGRRSALGDRDGALADFDRAVRSRQDDPDALLARAYFYRANGDAKRSATDFDAALELLGPDDLAATYHNRGLHEFEYGDYTSAIDHLSRSIASAAAHLPLSLEYRGRAYLAAGDPQRALSDFNMLATHPPYVWLAQPLRARALDALGRHLEARLTELQVWMWETAGTISNPRDPRDRLEFEVTAALNAHLPMLTPYWDEVTLRCELVSWAISQRRPRSWACRDQLPVPRPL